MNVVENNLRMAMKMMWEIESSGNLGQRWPTPNIRDAN